MSVSKKGKFLKIRLGFLVALFFIILILLLGFTIGREYLNSGSQQNFILGNSPKVVELTNSGFNPSEINIILGDTVTFVNKTNKSFWPASDIHPTHTIYPEFDAKRAVAKNVSFSFTFNKPGRWYYHDHLSSNFQGSIIVSQGEVNEIPNQEFGDCQKVEETQKAKCWNEEIRIVLREKGIDAAFTYFAQLYAREPTFVSQGCHWVAHLIGEESYRQFMQGKKINLTYQTSYCGYGYYHGFMRLLLNNNTDVKSAKEFCDSVGVKLEDKAPRARINCYHGIGHGMVPDIPDPSLWGNVEAVAKPGLDICGQVSTKDIEVKECSEGVFNAIVLFMEDRQYGFATDKNDPLGFCFKFDKHYQTYCLYEMAQKLDSIVEWDLGRLVTLLKNIEADETKGMILNVVVAAMIQRDILKDDYTNYINGCRTFPSKLKERCLGGIVGGIMAHGEPEKEYIKMLAFCKNKLLSQDELSQCFPLAFERFRAIYGDDKFKSICNSLGEEWKDRCLKTAKIS